MENQYMDKLISQIKKSGFPLELEVTHEFIQRDWEVENNTYYVDRDESKAREIDIIARYTMQSEAPTEPYVECSFSFVTEIKNQKGKPWVFFTTETTDFEKCIHSMYKDAIYNFDQNEIHEIFQKYNYPLHLRLGRSYVEGLSEEKKASKIFSSLCGVAKAYSHKIENTLRNRSSDLTLHHIEPLIVVSGQLFEAILSNQGDIDIQEQNHIQVRFNYMSDHYEARSCGYIINIVTQKHLPNYLENRVSQFKKIFNDLRKI